MRFLARQQMISAQGTAKSLKDLDKSLSDVEERLDDQNEFIKKMGGIRS
jgi:hypothetical protein